MSFHDDDHATLDLVLGQTHHLLGADGDAHAQRLVQAAVLRVRRDGGYFHPMPGDNWTDATYEAVLCVEPNLVPEFTTEVTGRVWSKLEAVLRGRERIDVFGLVVEANVPPLPQVGEDWRARAAQAAVEVSPSNQARRECTHGGHLERDGLTLASRAKAVVYDALVELQRSCSRHRTIGDRAAAGGEDARRRGTHAGFPGARQRPRRRDRDRRRAPLRGYAQGRRRRPGPALDAMQRAEGAHRRAPRG